jgi:glycosyltransferase involved in cell wall biosynthesis
MNTHVAIDASRAASSQKTGVGWYCYHVLSHLRTVIPRSVRVSLYTDIPFSGELASLPANWECRIERRRGPFWSQVVLANAVIRDRPQVFFVPAHVIPFSLTLIPRSQRPKLVTTIHDVVFREFPETYARRERAYADHATRLACRKADRIIVPTHHVARDIEQGYGADTKRIAVIPHGVDEELRGASKTHDGRTKPYLLYIGRMEHKKNVLRMIEAFDVVAREYPELLLVLAGSDGYGATEIHARVQQSSHRSRVTALGWVDRTAYHGLLRGATALLFPTLGEGFGLPILEAQACEVPVITSAGGVHEEVSGGAAIHVDPLNVQHIASAISRAVSDIEIREDCKARGRENVAKFSWQTSAEQTWEVLSTV